LNSKAKKDSCQAGRTAIWNCDRTHRDALTVTFSDGIFVIVSSPLRVEDSPRSGEDKGEGD
jgi:hypothetical protein